MKKSTRVIGAVALALAVWGSIAYAELLEANIQFPFKASGQEFAAGKYRIEANVQAETITLRNEVTGKAAVLPYTTRLAGRESEALVVFDKQGDNYFLSEIYMPGIDGFELKGAKGKHTHVKVKAGK